MCKILKNLSLALALVMLCQLFGSVSVHAKRLYGDLNGNGSVDSIDFAHLRGYLLKNSIPDNDEWEENADVYKDGDINALDFALLRKYMLGMTKELPFIPGQVTTTPTPTPATPTPQGDWISFIPQPENVALNLVIQTIPMNNVEKQTYIQATITFNNGGYRIVDEGKLELNSSQSGNLDFITSGVEIEKYVGPNPVTQALMSKSIKYPIDIQLGDKNHFDFKVEDTIVTGFSFTEYSIIPPTPVPYGAEVNKDFVDANTQFAADLFKEFSEDDADKNVFFSPFSISMALSMVYQGADTTTKEAMAEALNYTGMSVEEINQSYMDHLSYFKKLYPQVELDVANSIWIRDNFEVEESFLSKNEEVFNSQNSFVDFSKDEACDVMNMWIYDATKGKIGNMINPPIDPGIIMYLMNAIYFNGSWMDQFDITQTKESTFTNINGEERIVPMMNKTDKYKYAETSEFRAIELPYGSGSVSMYCVLPETDNVNDFISEFDNKKWNEIKRNLSMKSNIKLSIPRFEIEYEPKEIKEKLTDLGMGEAFSLGADFSGIGNDVWIDDVIHKAVIDVNEKGTEAAAVTIIGMPGTSMPDSFIADKPFMFVIADNATGSMLFMGKVVDFDSEEENMPTATPTPEVTSEPSPDNGWVTSYYVNGKDVSNNPGIEMFVEKSPESKITVSAKTKCNGPLFADGWLKTYFRLEGSAVNGVDYEKIDFDHFWRVLGYRMDYPLENDNPKEEFSIIPIDTGSDETKTLEIYFGNSTEPAAIVHFVDELGDMPTATTMPTPEVTASPSPDRGWITSYYVNGKNVSDNSGIEIFVEKSPESEITVSAKTKCVGPVFADGWLKTYFRLEGSAVNGVDYEKIDFDHFWRVLGYRMDYPLENDNPKEEFSIIPIDTGSDETKTLEIYFGSSTEPAAVVHFVDELGD